MKILNIMFGKGRGGLEQAAIDYHEALTLKGHDVCSVIQPSAAIESSLQSLDGNIAHLKPRGEWDIFAARKLVKIAQGFGADFAICHGNRAIGLALKKLKGSIPVIGVAHNYNIKKRFPKCDGIFCITRDLLEEMVHLDISREHLFHIPNMIRSTPMQKRTEFHSPITIGSMGRFVEKKGFDSFLHALKALKGLEMEFKTILGGGGPLEDDLKQMASDFGLGEHVTFCGWVEDKKQFFADIDIFVLPSYHEPFGIVLIEAMAAGLPCITTDTEGPCEIIKQHHDAVMVEKARPYQMASELRELIDAPEAALEMGYQGHLKARDRYDIHVVAERMDRALNLLMHPNEEAA